MKKTVSVFLAALILLMGIFATVPAMAAQPGIYYVACSNGGDLNFRETPSTNGAFILKIPYGAQLNITEITGDGAWGACSYNNRNGWVMMSFLSSAAPDPSKSQAEKAKSDMESMNAEFNTMNKNPLNYTFQIVVRTNKTTALYHLRWAPCMGTTAMRNDVKNGEVFTVTAQGKSWYQVIDNQSGRTAYIVKSICQIP